MTLLRCTLRSRWLWAAAAYAAAALVVTYPLAFHFNTHLAGAAGGASDTFEFVWSTWWWSHALFDLGQNPAHISIIQYPTGLDFPLLPLMAQSFVLPLPITLLAGPVAGYNLIFLLSFVFSGLAGFALCAEVTGSRRAGFIGGLIWAFFPNKLGHAVTGHLFQLVIFAFPLAALAWWRLLRAPTYRRAVWAALALGLASTVHPIYVAYMVLPLLAVGLAGVLYPPLRSISLRSAGFAPRSLLALRSDIRLRALFLALGFYALLLLPLVVPALLQTVRGGLAYLAPESGTVELSLDALAFFLPAPHNPLIEQTPLAALARAVVSRENETIGYVGWGALVLSVVGLWRHRRAAWFWLVLALLGTVLAIGPLLKFGGELVRLSIDGSQYPLPLPYAVLGRLPFFEWSRAPGRLSALIMLGVSVLAALGWAALQLRLASARARALTAALSVFVLAEYLVVFPFPLTPAAQPEPVTALAAETNGLAVLHLPLSDNEAKQRALFWQTRHEHPLVGGRAYRDVPGGDDLANFLTQLLTAPAEGGIVAAPSEADRLALLNELGVGWVLYDPHADPSGALRAALEQRLGPSRAQDEAAALFNVSTVPASLVTEARLWATAPGWAEQGYSVIPEPGGLVYVYSQSAGVGTLRLLVAPASGPARFSVRINGGAAGDIVAASQIEAALPAALVKGLNVIELMPLPLANVNGCPCETTAPMLVRSINWDNEPPRDHLATFGAALDLTGYTFAAQARPGDNLSLDFHWRLSAPVDEDLIFFVHLLDAAGQLAAGSDGPPLAATLPTSAWPVGAIVADQVTLPLPVSLASGDYTLVAGWYRYPSIERLPVTGSLPILDDQAVLGSVRVSP
jgi:hypothetical protein